MRAWITRGVPGAAPRLELVERPDPRPSDDELLVAVLACGVCRTDLHVVDGDLEPHRREVVPGHEVVGRVVDLGPTATGFAVGDLVGAAWLRHTCGACAPGVCPGGRTCAGVRPTPAGTPTVVTPS